MAKQLDELDKKLLTLAQREFPITARPYQKLGEKLGLSAQEVIERIKSLKEAGYVRRLGGIFSSKKLGYISTLAAAKVTEERFYQVADKINQYLGVTHNYRRNHDFNLWFTLIAPTQKSLEEQLAEIEEIEGLEVLRRLPAKRFYKLGVKLNLEQEGQDGDRD
ncbi:AsnC family transcriptional regulator [Natroniella sulfidigena]|uniref:siroheme decarboxylase subunit alpha n=1 Tax=Natroniella sulfidigena TaxID=723921 RepID=UPI00200A4F16|nr:AsnC family transcriptional regulator [Natroniella sulfidigena]MCK8816102.1 AsnC family transcriptional regulator [Natroniella sulfidigena]